MTCQKCKYYENGKYLLTLEGNEFPTPFDVVTEKELSTNMGIVLKTLSEKEYAVLEMYFVKEYDITKIGEVLDISKAQAGRIKDKAIRRLRHPKRTKFIRDFYI